MTCHLRLTLMPRLKSRTKTSYTYAPHVVIAWTVISLVAMGGTYNVMVVITIKTIIIVVIVIPTSLERIAPQ